MRVLVAGEAEYEAGELAAAWWPLAAAGEEATETAGAAAAAAAEAAAGAAGAAVGELDAGAFSFAAVGLAPPATAFLWDRFSFL
jgi:hypothetical protein